MHALRNSVSGISVAVCTLLATISFAAPAIGSTAGHQVLARAVESVGGAAVLDGVKTMVVTSNGSRVTPVGVAELRTRSYFRYPVQFRQEIESGDTRIAMVTTPHGAFLLAKDSVVELGAADRHSVEVTALRNLVTLLKARRNPYFVADRGSPATIDGNDVDTLEITVREERTTLAVDRATGRILRQSYEAIEPAGKSGVMVIDYSDFREVAPGLTLPTRARGTLSGAFAFDSSVEAVKVNIDIAPALFGPVPISAAKVGVPAAPAR